MLIENLIVEASVANGEAGEFTGVAVWILAASYGSFDQSMFEKLLVEVPCVPAEIANKVANLSPNSSVLVANQRVEIDIDVCIMNRLIELLRYSS